VVPWGATYDVNGDYLLTPLPAGETFHWAPGANDDGIATSPPLVTLTEEGDFVQAALTLMTGTPNALITPK
jgi:hypothetical protein